MFKNYEEFKTEIKKGDIPAFEAETAKGKGTPNIVFFRSSDNSIYADGIPVIVKPVIVIELYTERNDNESEKTLEKWFKDHNIKYRKTERAWITSENWYQTLYEFELMLCEQ